MRVLQLIPSLGGGGAERQLALLAAALVREGVDVHVGYQYPGENLDRLERSGAALHPIDCTSTRDPRLLGQLNRLVRGVRPDLVHTWLPVMDVLGGLVARRLDVPWLLSERTVAAAYRRWSTRDRVRRWLAGGARGVVGNSALGLAQWGGVFPPERRHLVSNALPLEEIAEASAAPRSSLPLDPDLPLIVYAGRFSPEKNVRTTVDAMVDLAYAGIAVALLCGDGPERPATEAAIARAGVAGRVAIAGYRNDLWNVLKAAAATVSLSHFEGSPNVVLEAMACRTPLVVSDIPAHRSLLDDGTAWFVDGSDPSGVAAALRAAVIDRGEAARRAARAHARVGDRGVHAAAALLAASYRAALGRTKNAASVRRRGRGAAAGTGRGAPSWNEGQE